MIWLILMHCCYQNSVNEVIGEGQLFFYYKRLNSLSIKRTDVDAVGSGVYKLPIPKDELQNPGWVSNK